jgi:hypothetical protein
MAHKNFNVIDAIRERFFCRMLEAGPERTESRCNRAGRRLTTALLMLNGYYRRFGIFRVWMTIAKAINIAKNSMMAAKSRRTG